MGSGGQRQLEKASWRKENGRNRTLREGLQRHAPRTGGRPAHLGNRLALLVPGDMAGGGEGPGGREGGARPCCRVLETKAGSRKAHGPPQTSWARSFACFFFPMPDGASPSRSCVLATVLGVALTGMNQGSQAARGVHSPSGATGIQQIELFWLG